MNINKKVVIALVFSCLFEVLLYASQDKQDSLSKKNEKPLPQDIIFVSEEKYDPLPSVVYRSGNRLPDEYESHALERSIQGKKIIYKNDDFEMAMSCRIENQLYSNIYTVFLKKGIHDKLVLNKTTADMSFFTKTSISQSAVCLRSKALWGNNTTIFTGVTYLKDLGALETGHSHTFSANLPWIREVWVDLDITKACKVTDMLSQKLTLGAFSFQLGRGIALGDIYRIDPTGITFYLDFTVDQYAWGAKLSGNLIDNDLKYDLYLSIDTNKSTSLSETNAPTQLQAFQHLDAWPARGAGVMRYILAGRFIFTPLKGKTNLSFEPYALHYSAPEVDIEFLDDAKGNLTTAGLAVEFISPRFEWGFDCASNFGNQNVSAWDRNVVIPVNDQGYEAYVYTEVFNVDPKTITPTSANAVLFNPSNSAQTKAIFNATPGELSNGNTITGTSFYNGLHRFRNQRTIGLRGYMWVGDMSIALVPKRVVLGVTGGITTGALNPYPNPYDPLAANPQKNYYGFVPLRALYFGKRVLSFFGLANGVVKPLPVPNAEEPQPNITNTFSNLVFCGIGIRYELISPKKRGTLNANTLLYWDDVAPNKFDQKTSLTTTTPSSKYLGVESNLLFQSFPSENTYLVGGAAIFVPGQHYFDVQGKPTTFAGRVILDTAIKEKKSTTNLPLLGYVSAYSLMVILGYLF